jgi:SEC-C motif-containing protein
MMRELCPCASQQALSDCCGRLHGGKQLPASAEQLMRSRYSAFALNLTDYIVSTTAPAQQALLDVPAIDSWSKQNNWLGLTVHSAKNVGSKHAQVEFSAFFKPKNPLHAAQQEHRELSGFVLIDKRWYFLDPTVECNLSLKHPCLCGSGKKFKHCCAPLLSLV